MSAWTRHEPLATRDEAHRGPGVAFFAQWYREFPDGTVGVVRRTFRPTDALGTACDTDYALYRSRSEPDGMMWANYAGTAWSNRTDEEFVRVAAETAEPPSDQEWAEAVAGAEWAP